MRQYQKTFDIAARTKLLRELDGILTAEHHWIFEWTAPYERVAYWHKFGYPQGYLTRVGSFRDMVRLWWIDPERSRALRRSACGINPFSSVRARATTSTGWSSRGSNPRGPGHAVTLLRAENPARSRRSRRSTAVQSYEAELGTAAAGERLRSLRRRSRSFAAGVRKFRRIKRGYYSFLLIVVVYAISFVLPLSAEQHGAGRQIPGRAITFRSCSYYPASTFGQAAFGEPDYRALRAEFAAAERAATGSSCRPYPYSPNESLLDQPGFPPHPPSRDTCSGPTIAGAMCWSAWRTASTSR